MPVVVWAFATSRQQLLGRSEHDSSTFQLVLVCVTMFVCLNFEVYNCDKEEFAFLVLMCRDCGCLQLLGICFAQDGNRERLNRVTFEYSAQYW